MEDFKDIVLEEKCKICNSNLILMGSINELGEDWLVIRCLGCLRHPLEEYYKISDL